MSQIERRVLVVNQTKLLVDESDYRYLLRPQTRARLERSTLTQKTQTTMRNSSKRKVGATAL